MVKALLHLRITVITHCLIVGIFIFTGCHIVFI